MVNTIHNPSTCYFKIHCAGFLQSKQFQVQTFRNKMLKQGIANFITDPYPFHKSCHSSKFAYFTQKVTYFTLVFTVLALNFQILCATRKTNVKEFHQKLPCFYCMMKKEYFSLENGLYCLNFAFINGLYPYRVLAQPSPKSKEKTSDCRF